ncbi:phosphodiester glycosidase family protein, partial [Streptomyces seoulensis]
SMPVHKYGGYEQVATAPAATAAPAPTTGTATAPPTAAPLPAGVRYRRLTRRLGPDGPVRLTVLTIAPDARVRVAGVHGAGLTRAETVRSLARSAGALAAVNGTYFDIGTGHDHSGYDGDPIGLYAEHGRVLSEALAGRPALLLGTSAGRRTARIAEVSTVGRLRAADGARRELDGANRVAGRILGCGGVGGDRLVTTHRPQAEPYYGLCTDPDEVVSFTPQWGGATPPGGPGSTEALLAADRTVVAVRSPAGGPLPTGGSLYGIGSGASWLRAHAAPGTRMAVSLRITDPAGHALTGSVGTAVGGSARLLRDGRPDPDATARLGSGRAPRTAAAVTADGSLLLLAVDGRDPRRSGGATPAPTARRLRWRGAGGARARGGGGA